MGWFMGNTPSVIHDKPLYHGGTRQGLLNNGGRIGYGGGTFGGFYGDEITVTNLKDTGSGSLRTAMATARPKWITLKQGLTAPAVSTWPVPYNNAPTSGAANAYLANTIFGISGAITSGGDTTLDGRGVEYGISANGIQFQKDNCIISNFTVDFSQWWGGDFGNNSGKAYNVWDSTIAYSQGVQPIQKTGTAVNGQVYLSLGPDATSVKQNARGSCNMWYDHCTFLGVAYGTGVPVKSSTIWDFNDGGIALGNQNLYITISACAFSDMNKSIICGFGSTDRSTWADWISIHHCHFLRGVQRQPLSRYGHIHVFANYYDQPGIPTTTKGQCMDADDGTQLIYEGNLAETQVALVNSLAFSRWEKGPTVPSLPAGAIKGFSLGNVVLQQMHLAADGALDGGTVTFTIPYSRTLPNLSNSTAQQAFRDLILQNAGVQ